MLTAARSFIRNPIFGLSHPDTSERGEESGVVVMVDDAFERGGKVRSEIGRSGDSEVGRSGCSEDDFDVRLNPGGDDLLLADEDAKNRSVYRLGRQEREAGGAGHLHFHCAGGDIPNTTSVDMTRNFGRRQEDGSHCGVIQVPLSGAKQRQDKDRQRIKGADWSEEFSVCVLSLYNFGSAMYSAGA
ncbi:hypothetical protein KSP40_PGU000883 [Platanthera guangdongensis]|uniref:Uncharacterized protein n=1 Tax=Platanthera guangdongensis TaxID=2320717 RepID=A0ABR2LEH5_9ASPA